MKSLSQANKLILIIIIIVFVGIAGAVGFVLIFKDQNNNTSNQNISNANIANTNMAQNNQNTNINGQSANLNVSIDTSEWETYRNEELGFEVKYPSGWFVDKDIITSYDRTTITDDKLEAFKADRVKFELNSGSLCSDTFVSNCFSAIDDYIKEDDGLTKRLSVAYITQDGVNGVFIESEISGIADTVSQITTAYFISESVGYSISYYGDHSDQYRDIFKTFLTKINFLP